MRVARVLPLCDLWEGNPHAPLARRRWVVASDWCRLTCALPSRCERVSAVCGAGGKCCRGGRNCRL